MRHGQQRMIRNHYDTIVIGSGIGGLTCASLLAQIEKRSVLVLERHFTPGGFTHMFRRKKRYEWDVGVHYVGEMYPGGRYRTLLDFVTEGQVDWNAMPERYDRFIYPDLSFDARSGAGRLREDLIARFPHQRDAIDRYFEDVVSAARWFGRLMLSKLLPTRLASLARILRTPGSRLALATTRDYLDSRFSDRRLKAIVASQWGNFGLPPHRSAFAIHALSVCHMFDGGYYPVGGAKTIAQSIVPIIERHDGRVLTRHKVSRILIDAGKAVGVEAISRGRGQSVSQQFTANCIISNAGAFITYDQLVGNSAPVPVRNALKNFPDSMSHVCLYLGFKDSPARLGFKGENHWIYDDYDHDALYHRRDDVLQGTIHSCFASFPSLKDPQASGHTAELITFLDFAPFKQWTGNPWKKRGQEYEAVKARIAEGMLRLMEAHYPGFRTLIDYQELSTPLTIDSLTGHRAGAVYGLPAIPEKFSLPWLTPRTPIRNLYLTGADIAGHGIVGALMGGFMTTLVVTRKRRALLRLLLNAQGKARKARP